MIFALDPAAILHGFQFMQWSAVGLRQQRLLHARMEAVLAGDSDVHYGAVKVDAIDPDGHREKSNVGQSIAYKARLIPESIAATFEIDVLGLRARRLVSNGGESATGDANVAAQKFLLALALWKIRQFLADQLAFDPRTGQTDRALRLRSDCALKLRYIETKEDQGKAWNLRYRTQSNGAQFDEPVALTLANLVKVNDDSAQPLAAVPDFKPFLKDVIGKDGLEIRVTYAAPPAKPKGETPKESTETESDIENEDDPDE